MRPLPLTVQAAAGVLTGFLLSTWTPTAPLLGAAGLLVASLVPAARPAAALALSTCLGVVAAGRGPDDAAEDALSARLAEGATRVLVEGTVAASEPPTPDGSTFLLDARAWTTAQGRTAGSARLRVTVGPALPRRAPDGSAAAPEPGPSVHPGDEVVVVGLASPIAPPTNPGAYDTRGAWARREVHARLEVPDPRGVESVRSSDGPLALLSRARHAAARAFDEAFSAPDAGLLRSLLLGDRGTLAAADRDRFREAGAAHILAISGSHVAILVAGLLLALRRARCPPRATSALVLVTVLLFVPFTGSAPPVLRSAAGFALFLLGRLLGREPTGGALLAAVATAFLVLDPSAAQDPGFRLSFAAAAGLVLLSGRLRRALVGERLVLVPLRGPPPRAPLRTSLAAGTAAWLASTPVAVHDLGQMVWVAVPVGIVAVPLSTAAMLLGALAAALAPLPAAGPGARALVEALLALLRAFLDLPAAAGLEQFRVGDPGSAWYAAYLVAFLAAARASPRAALAAGAALLGLLWSLSESASAPPPDHVRVTFLDVGHGQAALLETPDGQRALLDAGSRDRLDPAARVVLPALQALGVRALDLVSASHADADHAAALPSVLEEVPARLAVVGPAFPAERRGDLLRHGESLLVASDGDVLLAGAWGRLRVLGPPARPAPWASRNDSCLVLLLETTGGNVLLPGDRMPEGAADLLADHPDLAADVLVLPHHGLPSGGGARLIAACRPRVLLASTSKAAVATLPPGTRSTAVEGALVLDLLPSGPTVRAPWNPSPREGPRYDPPPSPPEGAMDLPTTLSLAAGLLVAIALLSVRLGWLSRAGALAAGGLGLAAVGAFGWAGLAALLAPFLVVTLADRLPGGGGPAQRRTLRQVLANGLPCAVGLLLVAAGRPVAGATAFLGALAALGADSLATAIGTRYGGTPRHAVTGSRLAPGESGGVTVAGLLASVGGAALAPAAFLGFARGPWTRMAGFVAAGALAAFVDSALGALLQRKGRCPSCGRSVEEAACCGRAPERLPGRLAFLDNDAVNLVAGLAGAALASWLA